MPEKDPNEVHAVILVSNLGDPDYWLVTDWKLTPEEAKDVRSYRGMPQPWRRKNWEWDDETEAEIEVFNSDLPTIILEPAVIYLLKRKKVAKTLAKKSKK